MNKSESKYFNTALLMDEALIALLELKAVSMMDALVSVMSLQNTLINANGGFDAHLRILAVCTSVGMLLLILGITAASYRQGQRFCAEHTAQKA